MTDDLPHRLPPALRGVRAAVATKHANTATIARALGGARGLRLQTAVVDTDTLGTFTGKTPRPFAPRQVAAAKARWACEESRLDIGIGSEGSFFPHPEVAFITMQVEHVALTWRTHRNPPPPRLLLPRMSLQQNRHHPGK